MSQNSPSYRVALGGIISALSVFAMFLTGMLPALYLALPMVAGGLLLVIIAELGVQMGFITYSAISLLSLFIVPDKEAVLMFIIFFGHYPLLKQLLDKMKLRPLCFAIKLFIYNACMLLDFLITIYVLGIDELIDQLADFGKAAVPVLLISINIIFVAYDKLLGGYMSLYISYFKPKFLRGH